MKLKLKTAVKGLGDSGDVVEVEDPGQARVLVVDDLGVEVSTEEPAPAEEPSGTRRRRRAPSG